jgi:hypothetical protein
VIERCVILAAGEVLRVDPNMLNEPQPWLTVPIDADAGSDRAQIETMLRQIRGKVWTRAHGARPAFLNHPRFKSARWELEGSFK